MELQAVLFVITERGEEDRWIERERPCSVFEETYTLNEGLYSDGASMFTLQCIIFSWPIHQSLLHICAS